MDYSEQSKEEGPPLMGKGTDSNTISGKNQTSSSNSDLNNFYEKKETSSSSSELNADDFNVGPFLPDDTVKNHVPLATLPEVYARNVLLSLMPEIDSSWAACLAAKQYLLKKNLETKNMSFEEIGVLPFDVLQEPDFSYLENPNEKQVDLRANPPNLSACLDLVSKSVDEYNPSYHRQEEIQKWTLPKGSKLLPLVDYLSTKVDNVVAYDDFHRDVFVVGKEHPYQDLPRLGRHLKAWELKAPLSSLDGTDPNLIQGLRMHDLDPSDFSEFISDEEPEFVRETKQKKVRNKKNNNYQQTPGKAFAILREKILLSEVKVPKHENDDLISSDLCMKHATLDALCGSNAYYTRVSKYYKPKIVSQIDAKIKSEFKRHGITSNFKFIGSKVFDRALQASVFLGFNAKTFKGSIRAPFLIYSYKSSVLEYDRNKKEITFKVS